MFGRLQNRNICKGWPTVAYIIFFSEKQGHWKFGSVLDVSCLTSNLSSQLQSNATKCNEEHLTPTFDTILLDIQTG